MSRKRLESRGRPSREATPPRPSGGCLGDCLGDCLGTGLRTRPYAHLGLLHLPGRSCDRPATAACAWGDGCGPRTRGARARERTAAPEIREPAAGSTAATGWGASLACLPGRFYCGIQRASPGLEDGGPSGRRPPAKIPEKRSRSRVDSHGYPRYLPRPLSRMLDRSHPENRRAGNKVTMTVQHVWTV